MNPLFAGFWGAIAASSLILGALVAIRFRLSNRLTGAVMGFGSGALISSIAYELVPESLIGAADSLLALSFALGALTFFAADWWIDRRGGARRKSMRAESGTGSGVAIFAGTLLDGLPESIVLGIGVAMGGTVSVTFLVAVMVSNLPEGIAGTRAMLSEGASEKEALRMWGVLVLLSAAAAATGSALVQWMPSIDARYTRAFAGGAVLTMLADVMMPEAFEHGGKVVGILATLGFLTAAVLSVMQ